MALLVKALIALVLAAIIHGSAPVARSAAAADAPQADDQDVQIETRTYDVTALRQTASGKTYLLQTEPKLLPRVGRIILLRKNDEPVMAFRVLRLYPEQGQMAVRRIRRYQGYLYLEQQQTYSAIEKTGEIHPEPQTAEDKKEMQELEGYTAANPSADDLPPEPPSGEVMTPPAPRAAGGAPAASDGKNATDLLNDLDKSGGTPAEAKEEPKEQEVTYEDPPETRPYDPELDAGSSPPPAEEMSDASDDDDASPDEDQVLVAEEVRPIETHRHALTAEIGYLLSNNASGGFRYNTAGGIRYSYTFKRMFLVRKPNFQDALSVEGGLYLYQIVNFDPNVAGDSYDVTPLVADLRYDLLLGQNVTLFLYGGLLVNRVITNAGGTTQAISLLNSYLPAGGGGLLFRIGPSWDFRLTFGLDMITGGLMLRF